MNIKKDNKHTSKNLGKSSSLLGKLEGAFFVLIFSFSILSFSQGQVEMNDIAQEKLYQCEKIKDSLILELKTINKNDSTFIKSFEDSEKLWNTFVDEQFKLKFPAYESWETRRATYGSQFDMLYFNFLKLYCDLRISTLYDLFEE